MVGFELTESLTGELRLASDGGVVPIFVTIHGKTSSIATFLRHRTLTIDGVIDAPGFADHRPITGAIDTSKLFTQRRLEYAFTFLGDHGATCAFTGERRFVPRNVVVSLTLLGGVIRDADLARVGDVLLRFDLRGDLLRFAQSLHFTR